jgi:hypothetical protein
MVDKKELNFLRVFQCLFWRSQRKNTLFDLRSIFPVPVGLLENSFAYISFPFQVYFIMVMLIITDYVYLNWTNKYLNSIAVITMHS